MIEELPQCRMGWPYFTMPPVRTFQTSTLWSQRFTDPLLSQPFEEYERSNIKTLDLVVNKIYDGESPLQRALHYAMVYFGWRFHPFLQIGSVSQPFYTHPVDVEWLEHHDFPSIKSSSCLTSKLIVAVADMSATSIGDKVVDLSTLADHVARIRWKVRAAKGRAASGKVT